MACSGIEFYGDTTLNVPENENNDTIRIFERQYDFDENGLLYYLGTKGYSTSFQDPIDHGIVNVNCSEKDDRSFNINAVCCHSTFNLILKNEKNNWFLIDLKDIHIRLTCYTLQHYHKQQ